jgi:hypothetical protein
VDIVKCLNTALMSVFLDICYEVLEMITGIILEQDLVTVLISNKIVQLKI